MIKWVLLVISLTEHNTLKHEALGFYDTIAQCHVAATQYHWEDQMPLNEEMVCMRIGIQDGDE